MRDQFVASSQSSDGPVASLRVVGLNWPVSDVAASPSGVETRWEFAGDNVWRGHSTIPGSALGKRGFVEASWNWTGVITRLSTPYWMPKRGDVIADHVFRHGAVIAETAAGCAMFAPILPCVPSTITSFIDLERSPDGLTIIHGVGDVKTRGHVFFRRSQKQMSNPPADVSWTHLVAVWPGCRLEDAYERAASLIWASRTTMQSPDERTDTYNRFAAAATTRIFSPDLFVEWEHEGHPVAGMITQTLTAKKHPRVMRESEFDRFLRHQKRLLGLMGSVQKQVFTTPTGYRLLTDFLHAGKLAVAPIASFGVWFNQVRTALGAALCAKSVGDADTVRRSKKIVELALSAPLENGASPSVAVIGRSNRWLRGTRAFEITNDAYHLPDMSVTGFHLLEWHENVAADPRIIDRCRAVAEFLLTFLDRGAFPSWVHRDGDRWLAEPFLARCAASAAPAMFLARLRRHDPDPRWSNGAVDVLRAIESSILPSDDWNDFELALSCAGRPTGADPRTGTRAANTMSIYWAARAALDLAVANPEWLPLARVLIGRLSLFQQPHTIPRLSYDAFGGFACMNTDAELSDARQGLFVPLYADLYRLTGEIEFHERALAALRACFSLMLIEDNQTVSPGNMRRFRESDRGAIVENYGHTGRDEATAGYLSPDWGCGTSLYALGMLRATR